MLNALFRFLAIPLFCGHMGAITALAQPNVPLLTIGSKAPELDIEHWVSHGGGKFQPVKKFEPGKVYVVEFWATWCGPCVSSMPHLAEIQERFRDQGVQVISISDEDQETVTEFLKGAVPVREGAQEQTYGELTEGYCLTTDPDRSAYNDYKEAAGQRGIPCAFLVGKTGEIEWIGHPMGSLDQALKEVLDGTWDRVAFLAKFTNWQTWGVFNTRVSSLTREGEYVAARALWAEEKPRLTALFRETPDLLEQLNSFEVELEEEILLAPAIREYKAKHYAKCSDELEKALPQASAAQKRRLHHIWFQVLMKLRRYDRAQEILAVTTLAVESGDLFHINVLNGMCWQVYEETSKADAVVPEPLIAIAIKGAERAVELAPEDNPILDTLAHLIGVVGDLDRAVELETRAWERETEAEIKNQFRRELEVLKAKQLVKPIP